MEVRGIAKQLHVVSTGNQTTEHLLTILSCIHPFIDVIHIREKNRSAIEIYQLVTRLIDSGVPSSKIMINDRLDIAQITMVRGVQLAHHSLPLAVVKKNYPTLQIGKSIHSSQELAEAEMQGADYVMYGHIFPTNSKAGLPPTGLSKLRDIKKQSTIPVIAIGGIKPNNIRQVLNAGADGIAVMSGILEDKDPETTVKRYKNMLSNL